jgi:DNA-binding GntR family transcriptional regulator
MLISRLAAASGLDHLIEEKRARRATAPEVVIETLRQAILDGHLPPGTRLRQEELAIAFGVSRIPVREALRVLEHEGLARSERHRGYTVASLEADELEEIYELRIVLESHAVRQAVPLLTASDLEDLQRLHDEMEAAPEGDERLACHERFYGRLYAVTARPRLVGLIDRLRQEVPRSLRWRISQHSPHHHDAFFAAVRKGDPELAVDELRSHYEKVTALLRRYLREAKTARDRST